ncbi:hypothetical protein EAF00_011929 [Botryotinia globosa]|nr:hypothetical protein EAF00_011929 [Botryotinia globosa]
MSKVGNILNLIPYGQFFRWVDPFFSVVAFAPIGPWRRPRYVAGSRLLLTLEMSNEATDFRNQLKEKYLHRWGSFLDTRFELIDPLPDRQFYIKMYKDTINDFCAKGPPELPIGPTTNFIVSEGRRVSDVFERIHQKESIQERHKEPSRGNYLIMTSFPKGSAVHLLRDYFIKEFTKFPNDEVQTAMKNVGKKKFKVQMPLGYCRELGPLPAERTKDDVAREFAGTEGLHLGTAVSLALWRKHYDVNPLKGWEKPFLVEQECIFSKALEDTSKKPSSSFVSLAPEQQFTKETLESGDDT